MSESCSDTSTLHLESLLLLQGGPVLEPLMLVTVHVIQLCSLLNTLRPVEESLDIQVGIPQVFINVGNSINNQYVDGLSLTYGSP